MTHYTTLVYKLPDDEAARRDFLGKVGAAADECGAEATGASVHDELSWEEHLAEAIFEGGMQSADDYNQLRIDWEEQQ